MRSLLRSGWFRAFVLWTALLGVLIGLLLPSATSLGCRFGSDRTADPALPVCPPDLINAAALYIALLALLWVVGVSIEAIAFIASRVARWIRGHDGTH